MTLKIYQQISLLIPTPINYNFIQTTMPLCIPKGKSYRGCVIVVVFVAVMLDVMLMTCVDPILPSMLHHIGGQSFYSPVQEKNTNATESEHLRVVKSTEIGILVGAKPLMEMFSNVIVGIIVDRYGHRYPMLIGFLFNFGATLGWAYGNQVWLLLTTRVLQAIGSSLSVVGGLAFLASTFDDDEERAKANSKAFVGISFGVIFGYPFGSILYQYLGQAAPFLILAALNLADGLLRFALVSPREKSNSRQFSVGSLLGMCVDPYILLALGYVFILHFGLGVFLATGPAWMLYTIHAKQWQIGVVLGIAVVFHIIAQYLTGRFSVKYGRWLFCMFGLTAFAVGLAMYPQCENIWVVIAPEAAVRMGHGVTLCVISPLLGHLADIRHSSNYGAVYGLYAASYNLGLGVGPIFGGVLAKHVAFSWLYRATAVVIIVFSLSSLLLRNPKPRIIVKGVVETDREDPEGKYSSLDSSSIGETNRLISHNVV